MSDLDKAYKAATNEVKKWSRTALPEEMAKAIVDAALAEMWMTSHLTNQPSIPSKRERW